MNWTTCSLQYLHALQQKESMVRLLTVNNHDQWRRHWNISSNLWLHLYADKTKCNDTMCSGKWVQYNVFDVVTVCYYHVLPVILQGAYWTLQLQGDWLDPKTNDTYDLHDCDLMDRGAVCSLRSSYSNPCLSTPYSGCLTNVHIWEWDNVTFLLMHYSSEAHYDSWQWKLLNKAQIGISLDRFRGALNRSTELQRIIRDHQHNLTQLHVTTVLLSGKITSIAQRVRETSGWHWYDIFMGWSPKAKTILAPPLILLVTVICLLTLCNLYTCWYVRRAHGNLRRILLNI